MKAILVLALLPFVAACSTTYKPEGFGGGFSEIPISSETYQVSVRGNGKTSAMKVRKIALVRAADITVQHGYQRFAILGMDERQTNKFRGFTEGSFEGTATGNAFEGTYSAPQPIITTNEHASFTIRMLRPGAPGFEQGLDAQEILEKFGPEVGRKI